MTASPFPALSVRASVHVCIKTELFRHMAFRSSVTDIYPMFVYSEFHPTLESVH